MVSIIIPTLNRQNQLNLTLQSLVTLSTPINLFEIIIIDNGSTDSTSLIVKKIQESNQNLRIRYFYDDMPGLLTGRHRGAIEAKGQILIFIDDDIIADKNWLNIIIDSFKKYPTINLIGGRNLPLYEIEPPEWLTYFWGRNQYGVLCGWLSLLDFGDKEKIIPPHYIWGLNYAIRKHTLWELGGFHPDNIPPNFQHFQGDGESGLSFKAEAKGMKALYQPKALIHHQIPQSRLTYEYFDKRAFYQGVCNSFTLIRKKYNLYNSSLNEEPKLSPFFLNLKVLIKTYIKYFKRKEPQLKLELEARFHLKMQEGFEFHQKAFQENAVVRDWVLRADYIDYKLPNYDSKNIS